jgi:hypothetical protein
VGEGRERHVKVPRSSWPPSFPPVVLHTSVKIRDAHPAYAAAKSGDAEAALELAEFLIQPTAIEKLARIFAQCSNPVLLPIHAEEQDGFNAIPLGISQILSAVSGVPIDDEILQVNKVAHTHADGFTRLARQPEFDGHVNEKAEYFIIDDHFGMGGTIANLRGYVLAHGAKVRAATTLTASRSNDIIAQSGVTLGALRRKFGSDLDGYLEEKFGFGADCLTEPEGSYLLRVANIDTIRNRVTAAEGD